MANIEIIHRTKSFLLSLYFSLTRAWALSVYLLCIVCQHLCYNWVNENQISLWCWQTKNVYVLSSNKCVNSLLFTHILLTRVLNCVKADKLISAKCQVWRLFVSVVSTTTLWCTYRKTSCIAIRRLQSKCKTSGSIVLSKRLMTPNVNQFYTWCNAQGTVITH